MTSRINGINEITLLGEVAAQGKLALSGPSIAFQLKTTERWEGASHIEYHYCVVFNERIADFVMKHCPAGTLLHIKGNVRYNSHNKRTDVLVRELRRLSR